MRGLDTLSKKSEKKFLRKLRKWDLIPPMRR